MNDMARLTNGLKIRRTKKKMNLMNETRIRACVSRFDSGHYTRLQFLRAVSHSDTLVSMGTGCPICRADIHMVMRVYN